MSTDQLVLLKSRSQRLAEALLMPVACLPVGPILRALLGDRYEIFYGFAGIILMVLLVSRASGLWGARHGGEWVTKADRLGRLLAEAAEIPRWRNALVTMATTALTLTGILLSFEPLDHLGDSFGGPLYTMLALAAVTALGGLRVLLAGNPQNQPVIVDEAPPSGRFWSELRATLPLTYAAYFLAAVIAFAVAAQLRGSTQLLAFIVTFLIVSQLPLILRRRTGRRIYPIALDANLGRQVLAGVLLWGIPMGMMFSAGMGLDAIGHPGQIAARFAIGCAIAMSLSVIGGGAFGVLMYAVCRLAESRRTQ